MDHIRVHWGWGATCLHTDSAPDTKVAPAARCSSLLQLTLCALGIHWKPLLSLSLLWSQKNNSNPNTSAYQLCGLSLHFLSWKDRNYIHFQIAHWMSKGGECSPHSISTRRSSLEAQSLPQLPLYSFLSSCQLSSLLLNCVFHFWWNRIFLAIFSQWECWPVSWPPYGIFTLHILGFSFDHLAISHIAHMILSWMVN